MTGPFPAEAGPTDRMHPETGFSREGVRGHTATFRVFIQASSRLKPVLLIPCVCATE